MMVKVGKMFVCMETVVRVARRASAAAGSVASSVRAMVLRIILAANLPPISTSIDFLGQLFMVRARAAGCGVFVVLCGELLVAGSVA